MCVYESTGSQWNHFEQKATIGFKFHSSDFNEIAKHNNILKKFRWTEDLLLA